MKLWGGTFDTDPHKKAWAFNASIGFDVRLALQDITASIVWAKALETVNIITSDECIEICSALGSIYDEFESTAFQIMPSDEDIHTAVERRLTELIGPLAGKLHTGRSRNDQVATDFRLWLLEKIPQVDDFLRGMQSALIQLASDHFGVVMPGYTHLQSAVPILLSHWWLSYFWPLQRDRERLLGVYQRTAVLPLGSAAIAGTTLPVDRYKLSADLGFTAPSANSIDAVSDRDFAVEFLFFAALTGVHLSRLCEAVIIFSSAEFDFFSLDDSFTSGSSIMPQKKNPDIFELTRGKSGTLIGRLVGLLATLKALPSAYDKDLQEDKAPVFYAFDTLTDILPLLTSAIKSITFNKINLESAITPAMMATDLADKLVDEGTPFREAHSLVGQAVQLAESRSVELDELTSEDYATISDLFSSDIMTVFNPQRSVSRHPVVGGSSPDAVKEQIKFAKEKLNSISYPSNKEQ